MHWTWFDTRDCYRRTSDKGKRPYHEGPTYQLDQQLDDRRTNHNDHSSNDDNEDSFIAWKATSSL